MNDLSLFQLQLLRNVITKFGVLRHGTSKAVIDLIDRGFLVKEEELYVATEELDIKKINKEIKKKLH